MHGRSIPCSPTAVASLSDALRRPSRTALAYGEATLHLRATARGRRSAGGTRSRWRPASAWRSWRRTCRRWSSAMFAAWRAGRGRGTAERAAAALRARARVRRRRAGGGRVRRQRRRLRSVGERSPSRIGEIAASLRRSRSSSTSSATSLRSAPRASTRVASPPPSRSSRRSCTRRAPPASRRARCSRTRSPTRWQRNLAELLGDDADAAARAGRARLARLRAGLPARRRSRPGRRGAGRCAPPRWSRCCEALRRHAAPACCTARRRCSGGCCAPASSCRCAAGWWPVRSCPPAVLEALDRRGTRVLNLYGMSEIGAASSCRRR